VRATWAPKGETPVLQHHFNWKRLSMSAVVGYEPRGDDAWLVFAMRPGAYDEVTLAEFLDELHGHLGDDKVTPVWDGLPSHRSKFMKSYLARQRHWLVVERLPGYAPELNAVEPLWGNLKGTELANFCPATIDEAATAVDAGLTRIGEDAQLCWAFLRRTGLSL
jgi:transposase